MKKLIVALILLMMITASAVAVLKWLGMGPFEVSQTTVDAERAAQAAERQKAFFIDIDPVMVPLLREDRVAGTIQITIKLEVQGPDNRDKALFAKPRISHAFFQDLYAYIPRMLRDKERLDIGQMKRRLQVVVDKAVGQGVVRDVLIQSVTEVPAS